MSNILIKNATIINENSTKFRDILIENNIIKRIDNNIEANDSYEIIDCQNKLVIPGVIDDQVHFREPGATNKATISSESIAAVLGGTTSFMDMPNNNPPATTKESLKIKNEIACRNSLANYSFYLGATDSNLNEILELNPKETCGVKIFMGSSTGDLLVDQDEALEKIFRNTQLPITTHCEDNAIIAKNTKKFIEQYGEENLTSSMHYLIRSRGACFESTKKAVELAVKTNANLHVLHLSTKEELELFKPFAKQPISQRRISAEVCAHHLFFNNSYYEKLGNKLKCNPAVKEESDRAALVEAVRTGVITNIATDHAPHTNEEKMLPYFKAPSGLPLIQYSLLAVLELVHKNELTIENAVTALCHNTALRFNVSKRGFIREGYFADIVIIDPNKKHTVIPADIASKCKWSPFLSYTFNNSVDTTIVNGNIIVKDGKLLNQSVFGKALEFDR